MGKRIRDMTPEELERRRAWQERRRERYANDPEFRQHTLDRSAAWRAENKDKVRRYARARRLGILER